MFSQMCNGGYVHLFILRVDKTSLAYLMELRLKIIFHQKAPCRIFEGSLFRLSAILMISFTTEIRDLSSTKSFD